MLRNCNGIADKKTPYPHSIPFHTKIARYQINAVESALKRMKDADNHKPAEL